MQSHHQSDFFEEISSLEGVTLKVMYFDEVPIERTQLGWNSECLSYYEEHLQESIQEIDIENRFYDYIHIVSGYHDSRVKALIERLVSSNIKWLYWSEKSGVGLAKHVRFNKLLQSILYYPYLYFKSYFRLARIINRDALGALSIGQAAFTDFTRWGVRPENIRNQPYAVRTCNEPDAMVKLVYSNEPLVFGYVGELSDRKGTDILIRSFALLINTREDINARLVLVGPDRTHGSYAHLCDSLNIRDNVDFIGAVDSNLVQGYYKKFSVFVLPSRFDGWGAVLNEAASYGLPLIATTQCGASSDIIKPDSNGFIFDINGNVLENLSDLLERYVTNYNLVNKHSLSSIEISRGFKPKKLAEKLIHNLKELDCKHENPN
ncbi:glycosyltransferase family 4 protein [Vibrio breoganii]